MSGGNIQAGEPVGKRADLESVDDIAVHAFLDQLGRPALPRGNHRESAGHRLERRIRKRVVEADQRKGVGRAVPGTHILLGACKVHP